MTTFVLFALFGLLLALAVLMMITAKREQVCSPRDGYSVPEKVRADPELRARADAGVGRSASYAALLSAAPIAYALWMLVRGGENVVPTPVLAAAAIYAGLIVGVVMLPFQQMKNW